ncbi:hypothetical protein SRHO_G00177280 [Serrasalmus rhombeus]
MTEHHLANVNTAKRKRDTAVAAVMRNNKAEERQTRRSAARPGVAVRPETAAVVAVRCGSAGVRRGCSEVVRLRQWTQLRQCERNVVTS